MNQNFTDTLYVFRQYKEFTDKYVVCERSYKEKERELERLREENKRWLETLCENKFWRRIAECVYTQEYINVFFKNKETTLKEIQENLRVAGYSETSITVYNKQNIPVWKKSYEILCHHLTLSETDFQDLQATIRCKNLSEPQTRTHTSDTAENNRRWALTEYKEAEEMFIEAQRNIISVLMRIQNNEENKYD